MLYDNCGICDGVNDTCTLKKGKVDILTEKGTSIRGQYRVAITHLCIQLYFSIQCLFNAARMHCGL